VQAVRCSGEKCRLEYSIHHGKQPEYINMCFAATCDKCGKTTWKGCGKHVDSVMSKVPKEDQCVCASTTKGDEGGEREGGERERAAASDGGVEQRAVGGE